MSHLDITNAQAYGRDAADSARKLAEEVERLSASLRALADLLAKGDGNASARAADLVSAYTQQVGNGGTRLWSIVQNAADADREFRAALAGESP